MRSHTISSSRRNERDAIDDAKLVVVMGHGFQPAVERAASTRSKGTLELLSKLPIGAAGKQVKEGDPTALDPHVWLDPTLMRAILDAVTGALTRVKPAHRAAFEAHAATFDAELDALDGRYRAGLANCTRHVIVTSHEAFGYLAKAYGLQQEGVSGLSPDAEPDAKRIAQLTDLVRRLGITTIFTETLVSPRIADTLAREAGVKTDVLDPLEGLTRKEVKAGADYVSVMDRNLSKLRAALGCS